MQQQQQQQQAQIKHSTEFGLNGQAAHKGQIVTVGPRRKQRDSWGYDVVSPNFAGFVVEENLERVNKQGFQTPPVQPKKGQGQGGHGFGGQGQGGQGQGGQGFGGSTFGGQDQGGHGFGGPTFGGQGQGGHGFGGQGFGGQGRRGQGRRGQGFHGQSVSLGTTEDLLVALALGGVHGFL